MNLSPTKLFPSLAVCLFLASPALSADLPSVPTSPLSSSSKIDEMSGTMTKIGEMKSGLETKSDTAAKSPDNSSKSSGDTYISASQPLVLNIAGIETIKTTVGAILKANGLLGRSNSRL